MGHSIQIIFKSLVVSIYVTELLRYTWLHALQHVRCNCEDRHTCSWRHQLPEHELARDVTTGNSRMTTFKRMYIHMLYGSVSWMTQPKQIVRRTRRWRFFKPIHTCPFIFEWCTLIELYFEIWMFTYFGPEWFYNFVSKHCASPVVWFGYTDLPSANRKVQISTMSHL